MSNIKKLMMTAAGGAGLNVEEVFSTYLYEGDGVSNADFVINNGIDLAGEGGMVWVKRRDASENHALTDTTQTKNSQGVGFYPYLQSQNTQALSATDEYGVNSFTSTGFTIRGRSGPTANEYNTSGADHVSWTFRKAPKFFDVVTYTGNGTAGRTVSHNLGSVPGCMIVKSTSIVSTWIVYHRGNTSEPETEFLQLNSTTATTDRDYTWNDTAPTSTEFTLGNNSSVNQSGETYVAYLFAHNDGDGDFGSTADQDIIKCGSYTGNNSTDGPEINLGWEPQWLLIKSSTGSFNWVVVDNMRGIPSGGTTPYLIPNSSSEENTASGNLVDLTPTGFKLKSGNAQTNDPQTYIYIAIRRGPMAVPTDATDVFAIDTMGSTGDGKKPAFRSNKPVDLGIRYYAPSSGAPNIAVSRLTNKRVLFLASSAVEDSPDSQFSFDYNNGWLAQTATISDYYSYMWSRAPNFFDVVAYTGDGNSGRTVSHNLGVAPEMIWVKRRNGVDNWIVYHSGFNLDGDNAPETDYGIIDNGNHFDGQMWYDTAPTATEFTLGAFGAVNDTYNNNYIAYLFASLDGISKVGSYTGNGSTQTINCGFSSGARFVLIKRSDSGGYGSAWYVWDTERGIVSGNDPHISLGSDAGEVTTDDSIDPASSGFAVNQVSATNINVSSATYIYYAIA